MSRRLEQRNFLTATLVPGLRDRAGRLEESMKAAIAEHLAYAHEYGIDPPEIREWTWPY